MAQLPQRLLPMAQLQLRTPQRLLPQNLSTTLLIIQHQPRTAQQHQPQVRTAQHLLQMARSQLQHLESVNASLGAWITNHRGRRSVLNSTSALVAIPAVQTARFSKVSVLGRLNAQATKRNNVVRCRSKRASVNGSTSSLAVMSLESV